jgi:hypothetical protein
MYKILWCTFWDVVDGWCGTLQGATLKNKNKKIKILTSFPIPQKTYWVYHTNINQLMVFMKILLFPKRTRKMFTVGEMYFFQN